MNFKEKFEHIPKEQNSSEEKEAKAFNPEQQKLEGAFNLVNSEYKEKNGENLPTDIKEWVMTRTEVFLCTFGG